MVRIILVLLIPSLHINEGTAASQTVFSIVPKLRLGTKVLETSASCHSF